MFSRDLALSLVAKDMSRKTLWFLWRHQHHELLPQQAHHHRFRGWNDIQLYTRCVQSKLLLLLLGPILRVIESLLCASAPFQAFVSVLLFKLFWMIRSVADYCIACRFLLVKCFCFHSSYLQENIYWHHARWRWDGSVRWPWSGWKVPCFVAR